MKFVPVFLFVFQLVVLVQSQSDGNGGSPSNGGGNDNSMQPSYPATSIAPSQTSGYNSPSNGPSVTSQTAGQTTEASASTYYSYPTTATSNTRSQTNDATHTHSSNSAGQTASESTSGNHATNSSDSGNNSNNDNVGAIAGGIVGGVVGLALIGGLLTWLNRRGGCTSRTKRRRHNTTFDDFALNTNDNNPGANDATTDGSSSPFQRRMAPMAQTSYMDLGNTQNDTYSETTTAVPLSGYPQAALHDAFKQHPSDSYYGYANNQHLDPWQRYDHSATSPQTPNTYDRRVKPDAVDYKPHQI